MDPSPTSTLLPLLLGQLPTLLLELGFAIALLVLLLANRAKLGRARMPALSGAGLLVALALVSRFAFASVQAYVMSSGAAMSTAGIAFTAVGTATQVLYGVAILLLGFAIIRR